MAAVRRAGGIVPQREIVLIDITESPSLLGGTRYAIVDEEEIEGVRGVAAPVFDCDRRVVGAISMSAPAVRMSIEKARALAPDVKEAAERVSRRLGYRLGAAGT